MFAAFGEITLRLAKERRQSGLRLLAGLGSAGLALSECSLSKLQLDVFTSLLAIQLRITVPDRILILD